MIKASFLLDEGGARRSRDAGRAGGPFVLPGEKPIAVIEKPAVGAVEDES